MEKKLYQFTLLTLCFSILISCDNNESLQNKEKKHVPVIKKVMLDSNAFLKPEVSKLNNEALAYVESGNSKKAKELFKRSLKIEPKSAVILNNLGLIAFNEDSISLAEEYYRAAIFSDSTYYNTYVNYSSLLLENDYFKRSIDINNYVIKYCKDDEILALSYFFNTYAFLKVNDCDNAKKHFLLAQKVKISNLQIKNNINSLEKTINNCH